MYGLCFLGKVREIMASSDSTDNDTITITGALDYTSDYTYNTSYSPSTITISDPYFDVETTIGGMTATEITGTIKKQRMEIEALTDILNEIVDTGEFNIKMNLKERVLQKEFLDKLAGDNNEDI